MTFGSVPFLATRMRGDVAWITWLYVPPTMRRQGVGRRMVETWREHIPGAVREIRLVSAPIDDEDPTPFWEKLGFHDDPEPLWEGETEIHAMCRAVANVCPHDRAAVMSPRTEDRPAA